MLGLTSHLGTDDGGSLGSGEFGRTGLGGAPTSPFNPPSEIARGPADRGACITQCLSMGHDSVARHDTWVEGHADKAKKQGLFKATDMQKTQILYTCSRGCDAGTPFMFNFTNPSMPGLPILPNDNTPFGSNWTAPLLPGLPPKPMYGNSFNNENGHPFYGSIYNFSHPFYPFFGHPNGVGGTFQSVAKGHMVCVIKQVKAFKLDKTCKAMKKMDAKRNKCLADFLRSCAPYAWVEFGPKDIGNDHMTHVAIPNRGVTGFGNLRGNGNVPMFSKVSGSDHQDMSASMNAMTAVQKRRRRRRRRRLLDAQETRRSLTDLQRGLFPSSGSIVGNTRGNTVVMRGMTREKEDGGGGDVIGAALYVSKTSGSHVELPPPLSTSEPSLDANKLIPDPTPDEIPLVQYGVGGAPMISSVMKRRRRRRLSQFAPDEGGGYITTEQPGGIPSQPSPIDLPKSKILLAELSSTAASTTKTATSSATTKQQQKKIRGFTTAMYDTQTPTSTALTPDLNFDVVHQIAKAYGIQGSMSTTQLPTTLAVYGGKEITNGAPIVPKGPEQIPNGRHEMVNHALCMRRCKDGNDDVSPTNTEKMDKCLEACYVTYAPHLYTTLPQKR
jgi:hypothetical protein